MFLLFGVSPKIKQTGGFSCTCPACGRHSHMQSCKQYSVFTLFFIPLIPFGGNYIVTCSSCASVLELSKDTGKALERDPGLDVHPQDLRIVRNNSGPACGACGARIAPGQNFCPNCGVRL